MPGSRSTERWPRELLAMLMFAPPILGLVFEPEALAHDLLHQARSLFAIWIYVACLGVVIQLATDVCTARWPGSLDGARGTVRHLTLVLVLITASTALLAEPLSWICPGLVGGAVQLLLRGLLLGIAYLFAGRLYQALVRSREDAAAARVRAEQQLTEARYAALMSRTQPHFLHNALATAAGMVPRDPAGAERVLRDLGSLFREIVQGTERRTVRAADELETARRYLDVQRARFAPRLEVSVESGRLAEDELVPALVLLPFVENAVLHGLSDGKHTSVRVALDLEPEHVLFTIEDDGPGMGGSRYEGGTGVGTSDVAARLLTLYGAAASTTRRPQHPERERAGTVVELRIPREDA